MYGTRLNDVIIKIDIKYLYLFLNLKHCLNNDLFYSF